MSVDLTIDAALDANAADAADNVAATDTAAIDTTTTSDIDTDPDTVSDAENTDSDADAAESDADNADAAASDTRAVLDTGTEVTFASLDLPAPLLGVLHEAGVVTAFPIQAATIPDALVGRDVLGRGRTGSGKTLAFGLPTLTRLEGLRAKPRRPLALVLVPTRELAMQVEEALRPYARSLRLRIRSVYGGAPMRKQIDGLRYGVELLVATPGRLSDLIERGECELDEVDVAILDEADQMCDMGFLPHVCELMDQVAKGGQRLLFSATLDGAVDEIVKKYMKDPVLHEVDPQAGAVTTMSHHLLMVAPQHKAKVAAQIAGRHSTEGGNAEARSIFFVRTQMAVDRVTEQLRERGLPAAGLHGGMTQVARTKTLEDFKEGRTPVLIATDVAARGIHVDGIDLVVHLDPPRDSKDYLHRAGRTARAGQAGVVASLILPKQRKQAQRLMDDAGVTAEELDTAPLGAGPKWESAGAALTELTGAREVPEPGAVTPFKLPVRERERDRERGGFRSNDRRDGDRFRGNRDGGYRDGGYRGNSDRYGRNDRRSGGFAGGDSATTGTDGNTGASNNGVGNNGAGGNGYVRRDGERFERNNRDENRNGNRDERQGSSPERGFVRRDGDRDSRGYNRDDQRGRTFDRNDGERHSYGRDRDDWRGGASAAGRGFEQRGSAGRGFEGRSSNGRGFDGRGSSGRGFEDRGSQRPGSERRDFDNQRPDEHGSSGRGSSGQSSEGRRYEGGRFENRGAESRGFENRGSGNRSFDSRGTGGRGFNDRGTDGGRSWSDRGDRSRNGDRPGQGDRFGRDERRGGGGSRPRSDWDRGKQQYTSRDGRPRS